MSRAGQPWAGSERRLRMPGAVGVAHSRTLRVSRNRGIMRNNTVSSGHGPAPMCTDHPHRTWEPDRHTPRSPEKPVIPTKTSPHPTKAAVSHVQHRQQPRPPGATSTPPNQPTTNSSWNSTDLNADYDRSRGEDVPISPRNWTDLAAELDRSRHGLRPISTRRATGPRAERGGFEPPVRQAHSGFQDRHIRPLCHLSMPAQPLEPLDAHAGDPTLPPPPRCATPWPMRASRLNRLSRINGIGRADRRQPREKNPRLRVGLADAGTGEAGLSRRPSAKACAIAGHTGRRGMSVACRAW